MTPEENARLTQVGPGTPGGAVLRRYWHPICPTAEITDEKPKRRVRLLGEALVLFRDGTGRFGLIPERCPHRHASLYFGFCEEDGLRCAYHGWKYAVTGECIEQPFEPKDSPLKAEARRPYYPVQQLAGVLFAYMGPQPAPLLPRWETLVRRDGARAILVLPIHRCNWLQAQENACDPVHTYYLHGHMLAQQKKENLKSWEVAYFHRPIEGYEFEMCNEPAWAGIRKIRTYGGDRPEREIGHPAIFPNVLISPQGKLLVTDWRVPMDDENTYIIRVEFKPSDGGALTNQDDSQIPVSHLEHPLGPDGEYDLTSFPAQDLMAWETQGKVFDRSTALLGMSDTGIVRWRRLLEQQIAAVESGRDPVGVIRDPSINEKISFRVSEGLAQLAGRMETAGRG
jgi:5,5'-dehydrodivanillate O-demethylase